MFILYAIPVGVLAGILAGGRLERLGEVRFRLTPVAVLALLVQVVLFSPFVTGLDEMIGRAVYLASTAVVGLVVLANLGVTGVPLIVAGAAANLAAIVANGGAMPASPGALASLGLGEQANSVVVEHPALEPLTDLFAMPGWLPFANVFSVGDVLIGLGVVVAIGAAMRRTPDPGRAVPDGAPTH